MFSWLFGNRIRVADVIELLEKVRAFNAGAVDAPLDRHIDKVFAEWLKNKNLPTVNLSKR